MAEHHLRLSSTLVSNVGYVRPNNQDSGLAGSHIIAVADGMGGHAGGDTASTIAIRTLSHLERGRQHHENIDSVVETLEKSILAAHDAIVGNAKKERQLSGMGTTVDAVCLVRGYWVLAHIGDSRAYLLREGQLIRATKDHSYVQHLIDTGRITPIEAKNHPQRNVVMRVLGDFDIDPHPDISVRLAHPGDRWLLCSDGLSGSLEDDTIADSLRDITDREECVQKLVNMALKAGSTDNVTAVIGDATLTGQRGLHASATRPYSGLQTPLIGGAAAEALASIADVIHRPVVSAPPLVEDISPAQKAALLLSNRGLDDQPAAAQGMAVAAPTDTVKAPDQLPDINRLQKGQQVAVPQDEKPEEPVADTGEIPIVTKRDGSVATDPSNPIVTAAISKQREAVDRDLHRRRHHERVHILVGVLLFLAAIGILGAVAAHWTQSQYYLSESDGYVAIYQGVPTNLFGMRLSHEVDRSRVAVSSLPANWRQQLANGIGADSYQEARQHLTTIEEQSRQASQPTTVPAPSSLQPSTTPLPAQQDRTQDLGQTSTQSTATGVAK